jgi:hypothetical protein
MVEHAMHRFYLLISPACGAGVERVALDAADSDHALHLAEGRARGADVELWDGDRMLAKMGASTPHLWTVPPVASVGAGSLEGTGKAGDGVMMGQG